IYNELDIESIDSNPPVLAGLVFDGGEPLQQFDRARLGTYTDEIPNTKLVLSTNYNNGPFSMLVRGTQFGEFTNITNNPDADTENPAKFIFDLQMSYEFEGGFSISAGSNNIFNTYPDEVRAEGNFGGGQYDTFSPFGFTGGNWFVSGRYEW
ncbi:MAG: TonB-dependent receptor, partial [Pseudomonadota bacterium]